MNALNEQDDGPGWEQQQQSDHLLSEYLSAVNTIQAFIGGYEGQRIRAALLEVAGYQEIPPEQTRINFDTSHVTY